MMSIEAVLPWMGGSGMRAMGTVERFAATAGSSVGAGVAPTGKVACAGPVSTVCDVHGVAVGATVAGWVATAALDGAGAFAVPLQATAMTEALTNDRNGRRCALICISST